MTKAGQETSGLDKFFSSLVNQPVSGLSFFTLSLVSVQKRPSFPILLEQVIKSNIEKIALASNPEVKPQENRGRGRPKGSKNRNKTQVIFTPEFRRIQKMIQALLKLIAGFMPLTYLVLDGHFGKKNALQMTRSVNLHLISKLRHDSALYIPYQKTNPNERSRRKYGDKINVRNIPQEYLRQSRVDEDIQSDIYQAT
ncbi:hypothetical protein NUACC26_074440 [Scytonema sp. NUACC26]